LTGAIAKARIDKQAGTRSLKSSSIRDAYRKEALSTQVLFATESQIGSSKNNGSVMRPLLVIENLREKTRKQSGFECV
jgi:hypothetical protein